MKRSQAGSSPQAPCMLMKQVTESMARLVGSGACQPNGNAGVYHRSTWWDPGQPFPGGQHSCLCQTDVSGSLAQRSQTRGTVRGYRS